jgi:hypothetical protein
MRLLMKPEQFAQYKPELEAANIRITSKTVKNITSRCYELQFPSLTGGIEQMKREKELRNILTPFVW